MSIRRAATRNVIWNAAGMVVTMAAGFVIAPFLVHRLGETTYGLWILIASFTSYFGMLDLGVRGSVGRQIAFHRARGESGKVNALLSTATAVLVVAGVLALLGTLGASLLFTRLFDVPPDRAAGAYWALWLVGLNLALWLPLNVFDATLWASERFDLLNAVDILMVLIRTGLTFVLVGRGHGLVTLAWINLLSLAGGQAVKGIISFVLDPTLRMSPGLVERGAIRELFGYGLWYFLLTASRTVLNQLSPLVVGARLGVALVTPFSIATRLVGYAGAMIVACTGVLTPVATALHAQDNHERQRRLFLEGGKYCWVLALFFTALFLLLGRPLVVFWMGPELAPSARLLAILALGEALPLSQYVTNSMILGMGRHRMLACLGFAEVLIAVALASVLSDPYGLMGICVAFAIPAALGRGVVQLVYGCRLIGVSLRDYLRTSIIPAVACALPAALLLATLVVRQPPRSSALFLIDSACYAAVYVATCLVLLIGREGLRSIFPALSKKYFCVKEVVE